MDTPVATEQDTPIAMTLPTPITGRPRGSTITAGAHLRHASPQRSNKRSMSTSVYDATKDMASDYEARRFMGSVSSDTVVC